MKMIRFFTPALGLLVSISTLPAQAPSPQTSVSYEFFRDKVQPIFLAKRPGHARCVECHDTGTPRLQALSPGATTWNEEQSRKNFAAWSLYVVPGDPKDSRMLMHPLAASAGGDPFHAGGKHWKSQSDPEFQILVAWVNTGTASAVAPNAASDLDFNFYRKNVEPIFLKDRQPNEGSGNACVQCHSKMASRLRLQPIAVGVTAYTAEQSRANFKVVTALVTPGDPDHSRLLLHPLAVAAGGDPQHTGGKFWQTRDNPEWQTIAAWVSGKKAEEK
jgi:hypothetical protein